MNDQIPPDGITARRFAELEGIGAREASRRLRAMGCDYRQNRWYSPLTPHKSMDKWNAKVPKAVMK